MAENTTLAPDSVGRHSGPVVVRGAHVPVGLLLLATILLQRFAIPVGGLALPVVLPLSLLAIAALMVRGVLTLSRRHVVLFSAAASAMCAAAYLANWTTAISLPSLVMVALVFAPWTVRVRGGTQENLEGFTRVLTWFLRIMMVLAVVAGLQMLAQLAGVWTYQDVIGEWVPSRFLIPDYNTSIPLQYGSDVYKAQAFVFLEPSLLSQFSGLAVVAAMRLRRPVWQVALLAVGLVAAFSGTGLILLAAGVVVLAYALALRPAYVVIGLVLVVTVLFSPAGDVFERRAAEIHDPASSLALRFVLPYQEVGDGLADSPARWVRGAGPGGADRFLGSRSEGEGLAVVYPLPAKALFEYGLPAALVFLWFFALALLRGAPSRVMAVTLLVQLCLLGGYLIAPHALLVAWCLSVAWERRE